jgi:hypothetical protein
MNTEKVMSGVGLVVSAALAIAGCGSSTEGSEDAPLDGTFRVAISEQDVDAAGLGNGPGYSGTWTLSIEQGDYTLACAPLDQPGVDCGNHPDPAAEPALEAGSVTVEEDVVSFQYDPEALSDLTGCMVTDDGSGSDNACPPATSYSATWVLDGDELTFSEVQGDYGSHLAVRPWTTID